MSYPLINKETGEIYIGGIKVGKNYSLLDFQHQNIFKSSQLMIDSHIFKTYRLECISYGIWKLGFNFVFEKNKLSQVVFSSVTNNNLESFKTNNNIIIDELGVTDRVFSWGEVSSSNDPRSGAIVVISYYI